MGLPVGASSSSASAADERRKEKEAGSSGMAVYIKKYVGTTVCDGVLYGRVVGVHA